MEGVKQTKLIGLREPSVQEMGTYWYPNHSASENIPPSIVCSHDCSYTKIYAAVRQECPPLSALTEA